MTEKEIKATPEYKEAKKSCERATKGWREHNHIVLRYALIGLEEKLGKTAVKILIKEVPKIEDYVRID